MSQTTPSPGPHISELRSVSFWESDSEQAAERFYVAGLDRVTLDFPQELTGGVEASPADDGPLDVVVSTIRIEGLNPSDLLKVKEQFERTGVVRIILHADEHARAGQEIKFTSRVSERDLAALADSLLNPKIS